MTDKRNKSALARAMGISRASLYYVSQQNKKDWLLKVRIEEELRRNPGYGSRRLAQALSISRPRAQRAMRIFGIRPYRRRGKKYRKSKTSRAFPNLLFEIMPLYPNHIWAADFTELLFHGRRMYVSTIVDLFTRQLMGVHVGVRKGSFLTTQTLANALFHHPRPVIFHSDNGSEYKARTFIEVLEDCSITISRSRPGCPWENGYQESFMISSKLISVIPTDSRLLGNLRRKYIRRFGGTTTPESILP